MNRLFLVRHGENKANLTKEFSYKKVDYSLTPKGVLQAEQTAQFFAGRDVDAIYTSPLKRAAETATIIAQALGLEAVVMENLREVNVGTLEGQPATAELWRTHNQIMGQWLSGHEQVRFPEGEDYVSLWARFEAGLREIVAGRDGQNIIVVGHGGLFAVAMKDLCPEFDLDLLRSVPLENCTITEVLVEEKGDRLRGQLVSWAASDHLSGQAADLVSGFPTEEEHKAGGA